MSFQLIMPDTEEGIEIKTFPFSPETLHLTYHGKRRDVDMQQEIPFREVLAFALEVFEGTPFAENNPADVRAWFLNWIKGVEVEDGFPQIFGRPRGMKLGGQTEPLPEGGKEVSLGRTFRFRGLAFGIQDILFMTKYVLCNTELHDPEDIRLVFVDYLKTMQGVTDEASGETFFCSETERPDSLASPPR